MKVSDDMEKIAVLGAGSWGTALAMVLSDNGHAVTLWGNKTEQMYEINQFHTNKRYLPEIKLPHFLNETVPSTMQCIYVLVKGQTYQ